MLGMIIAPITLKTVKFPCGTCQKTVATKCKAICCDLCNKWIHIGCNNLNKATYIQIQHSATNWLCMHYLNNEVPFNTLTDHELERVYSGKQILSSHLKTHKNLQKILTIFYRIGQIIRFTASIMT